MSIVDFLTPDPGRVMLRRALRVAIVQPLTFVFALNVLHFTSGTSFASFACFGLLALADFGGPLRDRALAYLTVGAIGLPLIVLGSLVGPYKWAAFVVAALIAFVVSFAGVLRGYAAAAASPLLLPFVLALTSPPDYGMIGERCEGWILGVLTSTAGALLLWPTYQRSDLRRALAAALASAAVVIRCRWTVSGAGGEQAAGYGEAIAALDERATVLHAEYDGEMVRPGSLNTRDRSLMRAIAEFDRLRQVLRWDSLSAADFRTADAELAAEAAAALDASAVALLGAGPAPDAAAVNVARERHEVSTESWALEQFHAGRALEMGRTLRAVFQIRIAALSAQSVAGNVAGAVGDKASRTSAIVTLGGKELWNPTELPRADHYLRTQFRWSSPWLRNAVRSGVAIGLAVLIVLFTGIDHGFWIVLGTLTALRFDASGTRRTAWQVLVGTIGGFLVGLGIIYYLGSDRPALFVLLPITVFLAAYTPGKISLAVGQGSFTAFAITLFAIYSPDRFKTADFRLLDVVLALIVSMVVSALLWPRGVVAIVNSTLASAATAAGDYWVVAFRRLIHGGSVEPATEQARDRARTERDLAAETFDLAYNQAGPGLPDLSTWAELANTNADVVYAADVVVSVARNGRSTGGDQQTQEAFEVAASQIREQLTARVARVNLPVENEEIEVLQGAVAECLTSWEATPTEDYAIRATSLVWLEDWTLYADWLTREPSPTAPASS